MSFFSTTNGVLDVRYMVSKLQEVTEDSLLIHFSEFRIAYVT